MKRIVEKNGCLGCLVSLALLPPIAVRAVANMDKEEYHRKAAEEGWIDNMIVPVRRDFGEYFERNLKITGVRVTVEDVKQFAERCGDNPEMQWLQEKTLILVKAMEKSYGETNEDKVDYLTAVGILTKTDMALGFGKVVIPVQIYQERQLKRKWGVKQRRLTTDKLIDLISKEKNVNLD